MIADDERKKSAGKHAMAKIADATHTPVFSCITYSADSAPVTSIAKLISANEEKKKYAYAIGPLINAVLSVYFSFLKT